ncbi:MAG: apolipoprotein N-acyltransferase [Clostridia bacterium]|nr:apolipoprotein N-acyltransferase [Clostridia bacterium]
MSYLIMLICGVLTAMPYIFDFLFFLPYFTLAPLFIIALKKKSAYRHGLVFSLGYFGVVYHWFCYLYPMDFAGLNAVGSVAVIITAVVGMSLLQGVGTAFVPMIFRYAVKNRHPLFAPFAAASLWVIAEWGQNFFWFGVPWARLAVGQHKMLPIVQSASLIGALGVSFIIVLISGFIALAILNKEKIKRVRVYALVASLIFVCNLLLGTVLLNIKNEPKNSFHAAAIQSNIGSTDKWADDSVYNSLSVCEKLTREAVKKNGAKLVVLPETVLICDLTYESSLIMRLKELSREVNAYIAVGAFYSEGDKTYNSMYLFTPDGRLLNTVYSKCHLVPFGEYLPMPKVMNALLPHLTDINMLSDPLTAGKGPMIFKTELGDIGTLICFDSIYESLTLSTVREGAEIIILGTNDSWYKDSAAVYQHNGHAVLRAIESGRYVVRSANTGVSSVITDKGKIISLLGPLKTGYVTANVNTYSERTVYSYIGNTVVYLSISYIIFLFGYKIIENRRKALKTE